MSFVLKYALVRRLLDGCMPDGISDSSKNTGDLRNKSVLPSPTEHGLQLVFLHSLTQIQFLWKRCYLVLRQMCHTSEDSNDPATAAAVQRGDAVMRAFGRKEFWKAVRGSMIYSIDRNLESERIYGQCIVYVWILNIYEVYEI